MNAEGIVLYCIILGASFSFVNGMGLAATAISNPIACTGPNPSSLCVDSLAPNLQSCGSSAAGLPLNCNVQAPSDILSGGFFSLGYFLGAFTQAIPIMIAGITVPGSIVRIYFGSGLGVVVNAGLFFVLALWSWKFVANRPTNPE